MDTMTKEERSRLMSRIRGKGTKPEKDVRAMLGALGVWFRCNRKGTPDAVVSSAPGYNDSRVQGR